MKKKPDSYDQWRALELHQFKDFMKSEFHKYYTSDTAIVDAMGKLIDAYINSHNLD